MKDLEKYLEDKENLKIFEKKIVRQFSTYKKMNLNIF